MKTNAIRRPDCSKKKRCNHKMPTILHIDTATEQAGVCISRDQTVLHLLESPDQKNHAAFVQPAIQQLLQETGIALSGIDAVAVVAGPGSYTGLRVGLASAKGICYALQKPLILLNTLKVMAQALISNSSATQEPVVGNDLVCPLIDARRMEVFTAVYDTSLRETWPPQALILEAGSFSSLLDKGRVHFCGSGLQKLEGLIHHAHAVFHHSGHSVRDMITLAEEAFETQSFADLAYSEPLYVKEFFDSSKAVR